MPLSKEEGMNQPERELLCQECAHEHEVWFADHQLWNALVAASPEKIEFLCPNCFTELYETRIKHVTCWRVSIAEPAPKSNLIKL